MYQIIEAHYPAFLAELTARDRTLPAYVQREVENYLTCGLLKHGFLRGRYSDCHAERLVAFSCKRRGFCPSCDVLDEVHCQVSIIQTDADRVVDPESARFAYRKLASLDKELH